MRIRFLMVLAAVSSLAAFSPDARVQPDALRDALNLAQTRDDALFASFNQSYSLTPSGTIDRVEVITEFRRAVLIARDQWRQGHVGFNADDLAKALEPFKGLVTFLVQVRLNPLNTFIKEPSYDLYVATGPRSPPIAAKTLKRGPVFPPGSNSPVLGVRLEASFPRADIGRADAPFLIVTDEKGETLWQVRIDPSRYR
jgi:hypothetical protein